MSCVKEILFKNSQTHVAKAAQERDPGKPTPFCFIVVKLAFDGWSLRLCSVPVRPCSLGEPRAPMNGHSAPFLVTIPVPLLATIPIWIPPTMGLKTSPSLWFLAPVQACNHQHSSSDPSSHSANRINYCTAN